MSEDLFQLELLSLVAKITQEIFNHTGVDDRTLAEFVITLHNESDSSRDFKNKLKNIDNNFQDSFVETMDRLIRNMHPKFHDAESNLNGITSIKDKAVEGMQNKDAARLKFSGPALPNQKILTENDSFKEKFDNSPLPSHRLQMGTRERGVEEERPKKRLRPSFLDSKTVRKGQHHLFDIDYQSGEFTKPGLDERPILYKVYEGRVSEVKDYGAYVTLEGLVGRVEGSYVCMSFQL